MCGLLSDPLGGLACHEDPNPRVTLTPLTVDAISRAVAAGTYTACAWNVAHRTHELCRVTPSMTLRA